MSAIGAESENSSFDQQESPSSESRPRSSSTAARSVKKRAPQACHSCRVRKVKCDLVISSGAPCSNCREDEVECIAIESRRSRKYRQKKHRLVQAVPYLADQIASISCQVAPAVALDPSFHASTPPKSTAVPVSPAPNASIPARALPRFVSQTSQSVHFPAYVRGARLGYDAEDLKFLAARGALTTPETGLRDELIRAFVLYVHPDMPVLDLQDFFDILDQDHGPNQYSLILFQAVMFAGSAFVDMRLLEEIGFQTRRDARQAFYLKVKLLYDFNWELDRISVIQALLLVNYWYLRPEDQKDPWHWLGVCLSLGTTIGLNSSAQHLKHELKVRRLWRRLWWMCILRDRTCAISMRKPMRIREEDINTALLMLEDFETQPIQCSIPTLRNSTILCNPETRTTLARLCIEKIKLSLHIARTMTRTYTVLSLSRITTQTVMLYSPKKPIETMPEAVSLHHDLEQWQSSLPEDCGFYIQPADIEGSVGDDEVLFIHRAVLRMLSLMASGMLYRPLFTAKTNSPALSLFLEQVARPRVGRIATETAEMAQNLYEQNLVRYLPPLAVTFFLFASVTFFAEIKTTRKTFRDKPGLQFHRCSRAIVQLRETWHIADSALALIEGMIIKAKPDEIPSSIPQTSLQHEPKDGVKLPNVESGSGSGSGLSAYLPTVSGAHGVGFPVATPSQYDFDSNLGATRAMATTLGDEVDWPDFESLFSQHHTQTGNSIYTDLALAEYDSLGIESDFLALPTYHQEPG